jgi:cytidine deaminase
MKMSELKRVERSSLNNTEEVAVARALRARMLAYAPYSGYRVGASVISRLGSTFVGGNVENHIYMVPHAEMNACAAMIMGGELQFHTLVVATEDGGIPCGLCLQVIREWTHEDLSRVTIFAIAEPEPSTLIRCTLEEAIQVTDSFSPRQLAESFPALMHYRNRIW